MTGSEHADDTLGNATAPRRRGAVSGEPHPLGGYEAPYEEALALHEEDRLPWLESVDDTTPEGAASGRIAAFVLAGLIALAILFGGLSWFRNRAAAPTGDGSVIAAPAGPTKVQPDAPGGMTVEGQGDRTFATSEGAEADGKINLDATAEAPVAATPTPSPAAAPAPKPVAAGKTVTATVAAPARLETPKPAPAPVRAATASAPSGSIVQLGAYASEAKANEAWVALTRRFAYLAPLTKSVERVDVDGKTLFRLRANAGADGAGTVCGKIRVAGGNCLVVN